MPFRKLTSLSLVLISFMMMSGCTAVGVATSAGAVGGIAAAREGGIQQAAVDTRIAFEINDLWFKYDTEAFLKLNHTVEQGRVLVTGVVQNPDHRVEAIRLAWQPKGVTQVINEVRVAESTGITGFAKDAWVTNALRAKLIFDGDVQSINYTIDTVQSVVYLMGIAQDRAELNAVIDHARNTSYVQQVISYVKMAGESLENVNDPVITQSADF
jgi:osmotically-inducible protein OsmY